MNHWEIDIKDEETFSAVFKKLSDDSQEYIKDSISEIVKFKDLKDYEFTVSCPSIPTGIVFLRFPNNCEVIIEAHYGTLYYVIAYDSIDEALKE